MRIVVRTSILQVGRPSPVPSIAEAVDGQPVEPKPLYSYTKPALFLARLYSVCPLARQLTDEYRCRLVMGDKLPREIENPLYRYLIAISKLRLGILTEHRRGGVVVYTRQDHQGSRIRPYFQIRTLARFLDI